LSIGMNLANLRRSLARLSECDARQFEGVCKAPSTPLPCTTGGPGAPEDAHRPVENRPPVGWLPYSGIKVDILQHALVRGHANPDSVAQQVHVAMTHFIGLRGVPSWPIRSGAVCRAPPMDNNLQRCTMCDVIFIFHESPGCGGFACDHCGHCTAGYVSLEMPTRNFENGPDRSQWQFFSASEPAEREPESSVRGLAAQLEHATEGHIMHACAMVEYFAARFPIQSIRITATAALLLAQSPEVEHTHRLAPAPIAPEPKFACSRCCHKAHVQKEVRLHYCCRNPPSLLRRSTGGSDDRAPPALSPPAPPSRKRARPGVAKSR